MLDKVLILYERDINTNKFMIGIPKSFQHMSLYRHTDQITYIPKTNKLREMPKIGGRYLFVFLISYLKD